MLSPTGGGSILELQTAHLHQRVEMLGSAKTRPAGVGGGRRQTGDGGITLVFVEAAHANELFELVHRGHAINEPAAVVAFDHAYHGRTNLTMALTAKNIPYRDGFGPFANEIYRMPMPYSFHYEGNLATDRKSVV